MKFKAILIMIFIILTNFTMTSYAESYRLYEYRANNSYKTFFNENYLDNNYISISEEKTTNPNIWIASIFIAGLGQLLMGEYLRGVLFFLSVYLIPIIVFIALVGIQMLLIKPQNSDTKKSTRGEGMLVAIILIMFDIAVPITTFLILYIYNIIDAYNMNDKLKSKNINSKAHEKIIYSID